MSTRGAQLLDRVTKQIDDIAEVFASLKEADLMKPDPERQGRTVGDSAAHIAEGYHFVARFLQSAGHVPEAPAGDHVHARPTALSSPELRKRIAEARNAAGVIAGLTDDRLDSIPPPKSSRFSDGRRTLEQVIEEAIGHQAGHLAQLTRAVGLRAQTH